MWCCFAWGFRRSTLPAPARPRRRAPRTPFAISSNRTSSNSSLGLSRTSHRPAAPRTTDGSPRTLPDPDCDTRDFVGRAVLLAGLDQLLAAEVCDTTRLLGPDRGSRETWCGPDDWPQRPR